MVVHTMGKQILLSFEQDNDQKGISLSPCLKGIITGKNTRRSTRIFYERWR